MENIVATITEINSVDIHLDQVEVALVARDGTPVEADWMDADQISHVTNSQTKVTVRVDDTKGFEPGYYQLWLRIHDLPEVVARAVPNFLLRLI